MKDILPVYFSKDEKDLQEKIELRCKHISRSGWMKQAAAEKIEREENQNAVKENPRNNGINNLLDDF